MHFQESFEERVKVAFNERKLQATGVSLPGQFSLHRRNEKFISKLGSLPPNFSQFEAGSTILVVLFVVDFFYEDKILSARKLISRPASRRISSKELRGCQGDSYAPSQRRVPILDEIGAIYDGTQYL